MGQLGNLVFNQHSRETFDGWSQKLKRSANVGKQFGEDAEAKSTSDMAKTRHVRHSRSGTCRLIICKDLSFASAQPALCTGDDVLDARPSVAIPGRMRPGGRGGYKDIRIVYSIYNVIDPGRTSNHAGLG